MNAVDFLYYSVSLGFLVMVVIVAFAVYQLALVLHKLLEDAERVKDATDDISKLKNGVKSKILRFFLWILKTPGDKEVGRL